MKYETKKHVKSAWVSSAKNDRIIEKPWGYEKSHPFKKEIMVPGSCLLTQSGSPYRIKALTDCEIIEIGNHLSDKPIRIEDDYGRADSE